MTTNDVVVIGSGPAGCAAALTCARNGLAVQMITTQAQPNAIAFAEPVPLESVHPGVESLLTQLGAPGIAAHAARGTYKGIYASGQYSPLGEDEYGAWTGFHIDRRLFDAALQNAVGQAGIPIQFNCRVDKLLQHENRITGVQCGENQIHAQIIIDASGKKGLAGKLMEFTRKFFSPPLVCWTGVSEIDDRFEFDLEAAHFIPGDDGWTWIAPHLPSHCTWTRLSAKGEKNFGPPELLKDFPVLSNVHIGNMRWRMYHPVCTEGLLLCGDAAGVLDPAAGQGIFNALWSGMAAGQAAIECIVHPELEAIHLAQYNDWFVTQFEMKVEQLGDYYRENGLEDLIRNK